MRIAQILWDKVHYIFETNEMPVFPPDAEGNTIELVDITLMPEVQENWDYNRLYGTFSEPIIPEPEPISPEPYQPSNAEVAQIVNNLYVDLIIAGVI